MVAFCIPLRSAFNKPPSKALTVAGSPLNTFSIISPIPLASLPVAAVKIAGIFSFTTNFPFFSLQYARSLGEVVKPLVTKLAFTSLTEGKAPVKKIDIIEEGSIAISGLAT